MEDDLHLSNITKVKKKSTACSLCLCLCLSLSLWKGNNRHPIQLPILSWFFHENCVFGSLLVLFLVHELITWNLLLFMISPSAQKKNCLFRCISYCPCFTRICYFQMCVFCNKQTTTSCVFGGACCCEVGLFLHKGAMLPTPSILFSTQVLH
jgi:hypothetical protein